MSVPTKNTLSFTTEWQYRLGDEGILSSPGEKDLEVFADDIDFAFLRDHNFICPTLPENHEYTIAKLNPNVKGPLKSLYDILGHFNNCLKLLKSEFIS